MISLSLFSRRWHCARCWYHELTFLTKEAYLKMDRLDTVHGIRTLYQTVVVCGYFESSIVMHVDASQVIRIGQVNHLDMIEWIFRS